MLSVVCPPVEAAMLTSGCASTVELTVSTETFVRLLVDSESI